MYIMMTLFITKKFPLQTTQQLDKVYMRLDRIYCSDQTL